MSSRNNRLGTGSRSNDGAIRFAVFSAREILYILRKARYAFPPNNFGDDTSGVSGDPTTPRRYVRASRTSRYGLLGSRDRRRASNRAESSAKIITREHSCKQTEGWMFPPLSSSCEERGEVSEMKKRCLNSEKACDFCEKEKTLRYRAISVLIKYRESQLFDSTSSRDSRDRSSRTRFVQGHPSSTRPRRSERAISHRINRRDPSIASVANES